MRTTEQGRKEMFEQLVAFNKKFYGKKVKGSVDPKVYKMMDKYGDDFSLNYTVVVYKNLTGNGKVLTKNAPLVEIVESDYQGFYVSRDVHALEVYVKGVAYKNGRIVSLGGGKEAAKLVSNKVVFVEDPKFKKAVDRSKLGEFKDATICTLEEFADFCELARVEGLTDVDSVQV